jgi:hypothetical protein
MRRLGRDFMRDLRNGLQSLVFLTAGHQHEIVGRNNGDNVAAIGKPLRRPEIIIEQQRRRNKDRRCSLMQNGKHFDPGRHPDSLQIVERERFERRIA